MNKPRGSGSHTYKEPQQKPSQEPSQEPEEIRRARERLLKKMHSFGRSRFNAQAASAQTAEPEVQFAEYSEFLSKLQDQVEGKRTTFKGHLTAYVAVNGFLFFLNLFTSGLSFPWFIFPAGGWGIGLVSEYTALRGYRKVQQELQELPPMKPAALKEFRALKRAEKRHRSSAASLGSTAAFLLAINGVSSGFAAPWSLIPLTVFGALFFAKHSVYTERTRKMRARFSELLQQQGSVGKYWAQTGSEGGTAAAAGYEHEARTVANSVFTRLQKLEGVQQLSDDATKVLHTYLEQVKLLSAQVEEIDTIMQEIPKAEIEADRRELEVKVESAASEQLKQEYCRSIEEIDQHITAYHKLEEQRELLDLRIRSAINTLKKLRLDIARINSITQVQSMPHFDEVKQQSEELSEYIQDLAGGYQELK